MQQTPVMQSALAPQCRAASPEAGQPLPSAQVKENDDEPPAARPTQQVWVSAQVDVPQRRPEPAPPPPAPPPPPSPAVPVAVNVAPPHPTRAPSKTTVPSLIGHPVPSPA